MRNLITTIILTQLVFQMPEVFSQNISGDIFVCPNKTYTYELPDPRNCDVYQWTVTGPSNAYNIKSPTTTSRILEVEFLGNGCFNIKLAITNPGGGNCDDIFNNTKDSIDVQSAFGSPPAASDITQNKTAVCGKTDNINFSVKYYIGAKYRWTLPSGWTSSNLNQRTITATPNGSNGGNVSIDVYFEEDFLKEDVCDISHAEFHHPLVTKNVSLSNPSLGQPSGPTSVAYGDNGSKTYSVLPLLRGASYIWTLPCDWIGPGGATGTVTTASNSIAVNPSGYTDGDLKVKAQLTCNGSSFTTTERTLSISFSGGNPWTITGPATVCTTNSTFTLQNRPPNSTVVWSRSSQLDYVSGQGSSNYTVKASSNHTPQSGWVTATITGCGTLPAIQKDFWIGHPLDITGTFSGPTSVNTGDLVWYSVPSQTQQDGAFHWTKPRGFDIVTNGNGYRNARFYIRETAWSGYVQVWKTNACGNGGAKWKYVTVYDDGGCNYCPITRISPNPAKDHLNILYLDKTTNTAWPESDFEEERDYVITDFYGNTISSFTSYKTDLDIDLSQINNGLYVLTINHGSLGTDQHRFEVDK